MDIQRAKEEIIRSVKAYCMKDELGEYVIPQVHQRPILLIGPPGIGKTAIMEQVARECGIALVSYTITHHTRQSAVGLPFIEKRNYDGETVSVTEYTMSEIIAAVHEKMKVTGCREGILFIDEINCVSETLAPTMLQFLQQKTFGSHPVPEGWIIVAAGNPPEYNKSVRDFDIVTLDRVKKIDVQENLAVWKRYAVQRQIHRAILTYLELKPENFYRVETTVDGKRFVTARGWEDLSRILYVYEKLSYPVDEEMTVQYLQHPGVARDFTNYYDLYRKYARDYGIEEILNGRLKVETLYQVQQSAFDERLSVVGLLISALGRDFRNQKMVTEFTDDLYKEVKRMTEVHPGVLIQALAQRIQESESVLTMQKENHMVDSEAYRVRALVQNELKAYVHLLGNGGSFDTIRNAFYQRAQEQEEITVTAGEHLEHAFDFMERAFGESQEMVIFLTELSLISEAADYIRQYGCARYMQYSQLLLADQQDLAIRRAIAEAKRR